MKNKTALFVLTSLIAMNTAIGAPAIRTLDLGSSYGGTIAAAAAGPASTARVGALRMNTPLPTSAAGSTARAAMVPAQSRLAVGQYLGGAGSMASGKSPIKSQNPAVSSRDPDLSNYVTFNEFEDLEANFDNYYTRTETDYLLDFKQDLLIAGDGIDITENVISVIWDGAPREILLRRYNNYLQWQYVGDEIWQDLIDLGDLRGADGTQGENGLSVELRVNEGWIQWRQIGGTWTNLIEISAISGGDGVQGEDGADGREVELQASETHLQWRYKGDTEWTNIIELSALHGANGTSGREVEMRVNANIIQWRYVGDTAWKDLISLTGLGYITEETDPTVPLKPTEAHAGDADYVLTYGKTGSTITKKWLNVLQ